MTDRVKEFTDTRILQQSVLEHFAFGDSKIVLSFKFPRHFDIQFTGVQDSTLDLPLVPFQKVLSWTASRDSEYLRSLPDIYRRLNAQPPDISQICHFEIIFAYGSLKVLAEDFAFIITSR